MSARKNAATKRASVVVRPAESERGASIRRHMQAFFPVNVEDFKMRAIGGASMGSFIAKGGSGGAEQPWAYEEAVLVKLRKLEGMARKLLSSSTPVFRREILARFEAEASAADDHQLQDFLRKVMS